MLGFFIKKILAVGLDRLEKDDDCDNIIDNIKIDSEEKFNECLEKYALITQ